MKIILGTFKENADELANFLGPRVGAKPDVSAGELNFDDDDVRKTVKPRHVKTYIKRFLYKKGERENYQVLVEGKELRMIELEHEEEEEEKKKPSTKAKEEKPETTAEQKEEETVTEKDEGALGNASEVTGEPQRTGDPQEPSASSSSS